MKKKYLKIVQLGKNIYLCAVKFKYLLTNENQKNYSLNACHGSIAFGVFARRR